MHIAASFTSQTMYIHMMKILFLTKTPKVQHIYNLLWPTKEELFSAS